MRDDECFEIEREGKGAPHRDGACCAKQGHVLTPSKEVLDPVAKLEPMPVGIIALVAKVLLVTHHNLVIGNGGWSA